MAVYFFLMVLPIFLGGIIGERTLQERRIVIWSFFIFLLGVFVLRDFSVGRDIPGYVEVYERADSYDWFESEWIYMERGYVFLMKLCSHIGISFRFFMILIYSMLIIPLGFYVQKSSKDICLSLIIYICFQFFVFNMSAFRQTAAMGVCLFAFMIAQKNGKNAFIKYLLLVFIAVSIHKSAIIFIPAYFIMRQSLTLKMIMIYVGVAFLSAMFRDNLLKYFKDNEISNYEFNESITVGSTFIFTIMVTLFSYFVGKNEYCETSSFNIKKNVLAENSNVEIGLLNYANLLSCAILILIAFSGSILMRAATFYQISILIVLPNALLKINVGARKIVRVGIIFLMYAIFYLTVLIPSQFDIVPYVIGKEFNF